MSPLEEINHMVGINQVGHSFIGGRVLDLIFNLLTCDILTAEQKHDNTIPKKGKQAG